MIIGLIIAGIITTLAFFACWGDDLFEVIPIGFFSMVICAFVGTLVISLPATFITAEDVTESHSIVQLQDGSEEEGEYYLAAGYDDEYHYYQEVDGGYQLKSADREDVTIVISEGNFRVERDCSVYENNFFSWPIAKWGADKECEDYTFYVPKGGVSDSLNMVAP